MEGLVGNDKINAVVTGSITFPSESPATNELTSYEFTTGTAGNYTVTTKNGELTMTNASVAITIKAADDGWTYDGEAHSNTSATVTSGELLEGDELVAEAAGSVKDVADTAEGNNPIAEGYKIMHGEEDVTDNYVITPVAGKLTINPKAVTVTAKNAERDNRAASSDPAFEADVEGTLGEDKVEYTFSRENPEVIEPGTYENEIIVTGKEAQGNYIITFVPGTLTITDATDPLFNLTELFVYNSAKNQWASQGWYRLKKQEAGILTNKPLGECVSGLGKGKERPSDSDNPDTL